jgi:hypothetical protein
MNQILDHLQANESAADDNRSLGIMFSNPRTDATGIGNRAYRKDARQIYARQRRTDRRCARRQDERVVVLCADAARVHVACGNRAGVRIDGGNLGIGAHVDIEALMKHLARCDQQPSFIGNDVADVVG